MKKFFMFLAVSGIMAVSANLAVAQDQAADSTSAAATEVAAPANDLAALTGNAPEIPLHQQLKTKFIEGGPMWMAPIALVLVLGLALSIERILYLTFAKTNTKKLVANVEAVSDKRGRSSTITVIKIAAASILFTKASPFHLDC